MDKIEFIDILTIDEDLREKVRRWRNKAYIRKNMLTQHIVTRPEHLKMIETLKNRDDWKFWVIFVNDLPIGAASLKGINYDDFTSEWGFYIGEKDYRGRGLSKQILFKLLGMFFDEIRLKILFTKVLSDNFIALGLYDKFKFKQIDRLPFDGKKEVILFEFSRDNWRKLKPVLKNEHCENKE